MCVFFRFFSRSRAYFFPLFFYFLGILSFARSFKHSADSSHTHTHTQASSSAYTPFNDYLSLILITKACSLSLSLSFMKLCSYFKRRLTVWLTANKNEILLSKLLNFILLSVVLKFNIFCSCFIYLLDLCLVNLGWLIADFGYK